VATSPVLSTSVRLTVTVLNLIQRGKSRLKADFKATMLKFRVDLLDGIISLNILRDLFKLLIIGKKIQNYTLFGGQYKNNKAHQHTFLKTIFNL